MEDGEIGVLLKRGGICHRQNQYQGTGDVEQSVECLSDMLKSLGSIPSAA